MGKMVMKEWPTRGGYVPHPKPKYAPKGYHRCEQCNALVKDGETCCEGVEDGRETHQHE